MTLDSAEHVNVRPTTRIHGHTLEAIIAAISKRTHSFHDVLIEGTIVVPRPANARAPHEVRQGNETLVVLVVQILDACINHGGM